MTSPLLDVTDPHYTEWPQK